MLIAALARWSEVAPEDGTLAIATHAAEEIERTHRDAAGLFRHEADGDDARYLADQAWMLRALVALYEASGDARWRARASELADATMASFHDDATGALHASTRLGDPLAGVLVPIEENALVARSLLALARIEERDDRRESALAILRGVALPDALAELGRKVGHYAIAVELAVLGMLSFTVVGRPGDPRTSVLAASVRAYFEPRGVIVMQEGEGTYPQMDAPSLFVCGQEACSQPMTDPSTIPHAIDAFLGR